LPFVPTSSVLTQLVVASSINIPLPHFTICPLQKVTLLGTFLED
jgi:hypothetical protein